MKPLPSVIQFLTSQTNKIKEVEGASWDSFMEHVLQLRNPFLALESQTTEEEHQQNRVGAQHAFLLSCCLNPDKIQ